MKAIDVLKHKRDVDTKHIYAALNILKRLQQELYEAGEFQGWRIITRVYEHVAEEL